MSKKMHAVVISTTQAGHINPMFEFCRRLAPFDMTVSFLVTEQHQARLVKKLKDEHIRLVLFPVVISHTDETEPSDLEDLITTLEPPVTCIISDSFLSWSQDLANRLGIPRVGFGTTSGLTEIIMLNIPLLRSRGFLPVKAGDLNDDTQITFVPGIPNLRRAELPFAFYEEEPHTSCLGRAYLRLPEALCILEHTVEELEPEPVAAWRDANFKYLPIGPLIPSVFQVEDVQLSETDLNILKWLDEQEACSVLYIAFGSQASLPMEQVNIIAEGVLASKQPFLWAMRRNFVSGSSPNIYDMLKERLESGAGLVLEWAPQSLILEHPSVGGFFTHCGWSSTMEAICSGVPTLCWACEVDQNQNSYLMIKKWKIGLKVGEGLHDDPSTEHIVKVIRTLMKGEEGDQLRNVARRLKHVARSAWDEDGSSSKNLREFIQQLMTS